MKSTDFIAESIGEDADEMHRDHEVQMARADCYNSAKYAIELHKILHKVSEEQGLEGWVSEKITLACDYLRTVHEYLSHEEAMKQSDVLPAFTFEGAEEAFKKKLSENQSHSHDDDEEEDCEVCHGTGEGRWEGQRCSACHGTGVQARSDSNDDFDIGDTYDDNEDEPESHYEKHVRVHGLGEGEDEELFGHSDKAELYNAVRGMRRGGEVSGTSSNGFVTTTYDQLVNTFGEPMYGPSDESDDEKISCEWVITFGDKNRTVATIYDWKTYEGTPMEEYDWHIGGKHGSRATDFVEAALKFKQGVSEEGGGGYPATPKYKVGDTVCVRGYQGSGRIAFIKDINDVGVIFDHPQKGLKVKTTINKLLPKQGVSEEGKGLWANIHAKQERIKHGSHERMRKPGSKGAPSKQDFIDSQKTSKNEQRISEMTAGGTGAGGFATGPTAGGNFKKTTGVPKKVKNVVKPKNVQVGKGIY